MRTALVVHPPHYDRRGPRRLAMRIILHPVGMIGADRTFIKKETAYSDQGRSAASSHRHGHLPVGTDGKWEGSDYVGSVLFETYSEKGIRQPR